MNTTKYTGARKDGMNTIYSIDSANAALHSAWTVLELRQLNIDRLPTGLGETPRPRVVGFHRNAAPRENLWFLADITNLTVYCDTRSLVITASQSR